MEDEYIIPESPVEEIEIPQQPIQEVHNEKWDSLTPLEKIRIASSQNGVTIKEPDKSCKYCYGKGYIATKTLEQDDESKVELPVPCRCIFHKQDIPKMFTGLKNLNRVDRRKNDLIEQKKSSIKKLEEIKKIKLEKIKKEKKTKKKLHKKFNKK